MLQLQQGAVAPEFTLQDHTGTMRSLSEFKGSYVVLYFYPKDDTPGCTKEACMIRDVYNDFETEGIVVLGVSKDSPESHVKFREKYQLPFILLSDMDKSVIGAYGADGILFNKRITYVIDPNGIIAKIYPNVDPAGHAMELLNDIKNLQK
ncbi:MAG TPA: peroxiredoxin [Candidatus Paceibacterota bacterium]|nr:peroxiredoxin [Candidatus Paceibacterota bacterium]